MLDHRRGQVFNFLRSRLALPGVHRPVFLFESLTGAFQTPFSPFDPSLSLFCAGGMKNEVDRVRAGILRNRGRDASRNEAIRSRIQLKPIEHRFCFSVSKSLRDFHDFLSRVCSPTLSGSAKRKRLEKSERRSTNDWLRERSRESGTAVLVVPFKNIQEEGGRGRSAETTREAWKKF